MFGTCIRAWAWFVDGIAEALLEGFGRLARRPKYRIEITERKGAVRTPDGSEIGRMIETDGAMRFEPREIARRLAGADVDLAIPPSWLFRRNLDPVAAQSAPYLDAFVRHQIERITPWRAADVHYRIRHAPMPEDPTRLSVAVGVVPKRLMQASVNALQPLGPNALRLVVAPAGGHADGFTISLGDRFAQRVAAIRRPVAIALATVVLGMVGTLSWAWWETGIVRAEIDDEDQVIGERRAVLAAAAQRDRAGADAEATLRALRNSRPRTVDLLDALSAALPDSAYLTELTIENAHLRVSGVSTAMPQLVPALETSGHFADVAFSAATTRLESGAGDRFHLEMRAVGAGAEAASR